MASDAFDESNEFDDLGNEELRDLLEDLQGLKREKERLEENRGQLERSIRIKETSARLIQAAEFAQNIVNSVKFKEAFCRLYNHSITETTLDIGEIVIGIVSSAQLPPVIVALIIIAVRKIRNRLDDYCD